MRLPLVFIFTRQNRSETDRPIRSSGADNRDSAAISRKPVGFMAVGHFERDSSNYFLPRLIGSGRLSLPVKLVAMAPGCNGGMTAAGVGAITGIGLTSGTGFFVREMVGGGFFGMELIMPSLWLEIKSEGLVGCTVMPSSRGMYRSRHPSAGRPSEAGRNDYVESPAKLERQFQEALERNRQQLDEQRARIKREAAVQADWPVLPLRAKNTVSPHAR